MRISITIMAVALASAGCADESGGADDVVGSELCGNGVVEGAEACDDGNDDRFDGCLPGCEAVDPLDAPALTWTYYEIPGTKCIDGSPSGFSVNINPESPNLLIYLEGGGACFNDYCDSLFTWSGNMPNGTGIFDRANAENPVADWSLVYVPYCSGDIYAGDNEAMVGGELRYFYGYSNFTAFLEHWVPAFGDLDQVALSGSSAGGFGAFSNFPQTQRAFGDVPVTLIDDSGPPMSSDVFPPCLQETFRTTWGFDRTLIAECGDACSEDDFVLGYLDHVRAEFPDMRGGVFSSLQDTTIRLFAGYGWYGGWNMCAQFPTSVTGAKYTEGLYALRDHLEAGGPDIGSYLIDGNSHTVLRSGGLYSMSAGGTSPAEWLRTTLAGVASHVGPQ
jgi:cysteine-rich repeat protein